MTTTPNKKAGELDLDKIEALARAATPGPWHAPGMGEIHAENHDEIAQILYHEQDGDDGQCGTDADAEFIAAANPAAVLKLVELARSAAPAPAVEQSAEKAIWDAVTRLERQDSTHAERIAAADGLRAIAASRRTAGDVSAVGLMKMWKQAEELATPTMPAPFQFAKLLLAPSAPVSESRTAGDALPVGWRDKLRRSGANTDYHGLIAFTGAQLEHFVSMLAAPVSAGQAGQVAMPDSRNEALQIATKLLNVEVKLGALHADVDAFSKELDADLAKYGAAPERSDTPAGLDTQRLDYLDAWVQENKARGIHWFTFSFTDEKSARVQIDAEMRLRPARIDGDSQGGKSVAASKASDAAAGAHHLTHENVAAVIKDLREIEDGTTERPIQDRDWRTWAGVLARIMEYLAAPRTAGEVADTMERLMIEKRIEVTPEYEGGWRAYIFRDSEEPKATGYGETPSAAVKVALDRESATAAEEAQKGEAK